MIEALSAIAVVPPSSPSSPNAADAVSRPQGDVGYVTPAGNERALGAHDAHPYGVTGAVEPMTGKLFAQWGQPALPTATAQPSAGPRPVHGAGPLAPGDRILATVDRYGAIMTGRWQSIDALSRVNGKLPSAAAMLQVSSAMLQMSVEHELIGKVVSLSTRAVDGLVKLS